MQPLYFLPRATDALRATIIARGLGHVFDDVADGEISSCEVIGTGPDGKSPGFVVAANSVPITNAAGDLVPGKPPRECQYKAERQSWQPLPGESDVWIGTASGEPPTPREMQRRRLIAGATIQLGDGADWQIPELRRPDDGSSLPHAFRFDDAGKVHQTLDGRYREIWERSELAIEAFTAPVLNTNESIEWAIPLAIDALALNYRFARGEQNALALVTSSNWVSVLAAIIGFFDPVVAAQVAAKKKDRATSAVNTNTTPGPADDCPATDPAAATSTASPRS